MPTPQLPVDNDHAVDPFSLIGVGFGPGYGQGSAAKVMFNGNATTGTPIVSNFLGAPKTITLSLASVGGPNTIKIQTSFDGTNWVQATDPDEGANQNVNLRDVGDPTNPTDGTTTTVDINPAPFYRVIPSANTQLIINHIASY